MSVTFADLFCGAGGSISGMVEAGFELVLGMNHDPTSIETVSSNYRDADFVCADINNYDMRRLPHTDVLWASVICTEMSPAGGQRKHRGQGVLAFEEQGHVPSESYERTRACALDVVRATEVHRYKAIIVENVVEFARDWELYDWWVEGMCHLGYEVQVANISAAHVYGEGNDPAPQWRDRIFIVFTQKGIPLPDLNLRPPSWCELCEAVVEGEQRWKRPGARRVGKYGQQYIYVCPQDSSIVEPFVLPAIAALDLSDVGTRIADRTKPLSERTLARIQWGLDNLTWPVITQVAGNTFERPGYHRAWPGGEAPLSARQTTGTDAIAGPLMVNHGHTDDRMFVAASQPLPTRTTKIGEGFATAPFMVTNNTGGVGRRVRPADGSPLSTVVAQGRGHHQNFGGNAQPKDLAKSLDVPLGSITTHDHHALVIPYRKGSRAHRAEDSPLGAQTTHTSEGLLRADLDIMECHYRTLKPREHAAAQRFLPTYLIAGNQGQQTMQAGNAVAVNAAHFIGERLLAALA